jgi:broad specificity phosphatase PhoE
VLAWRDRLWGALHALPAGTVVFTHFMVINAVVSLLEGRERLVVFEPDYCSATVLAPEAATVRLITLGESRATRVLV